MTQASKFTIWHGIAASLVVHSALALPFMVSALAPLPDEPPLLVIDLQGIVSDYQIEQKVKQETPATPPQHEAASTQPAQADEKPPDDPNDVAEDTATPTSPPPQSPAAAVAKQPADADGSKSVKGVEEQQIAQTIRTDHDAEKDRLNAYIRSLGRKIRAHLVYPADGRRAAATVSFAILSNGQLRPGSLKIVESSGQPALDASALKTIRTSVPFDAPPQEMTIAITVDFDRKR